MKPSDIKYLTFQGGGVACIAYAGVIRRFEEAGIIQQCSGFAGTSGGSIVAALLADGKSADSIERLLDHDFHDFTRDYFGVAIEAVGDLHRLFNEGGLNTGRRLRNWLHDIFQGKVLSELPKKLVITAVPYETIPWDVKLFSNGLTPTVYISDACRASCGIPIFFTPWDIYGVKYFDGGLLANNPAPILKLQGFTRDCTVNLRLEQIDTRRKASGLVGMLSTLTNGLVQASQLYEIEHPVELWIDRGTVEATDFNLDKGDKELLVERGYRAADEWIIGNS